MAESRFKLFSGIVVGMFVMADYLRENSERILTPRRDRYGPETRTSHPIALRKEYPIRRSRAQPRCCYFAELVFYRLV